MKTNVTLRSLKSKLGQNTAEYLIMLTLVAVGSIGLVSLFGTSVRNKFTEMTAALSGNAAEVTNATGRLDKGVTESAKAAKDKNGMKTEGDVVEGFDIK